MAWWDKPLTQPEPEEQSVDTADIQTMTKEDERKAWRLLMLVDALRDARPQEPVSLDEIDTLGRVAKGYHDLHDACAAIRNGCALGTLARIFT